MSQPHEYYMRKCIELARRGYGEVNPNPMVGALIVKDDKIIAQGWHRKAGLPHAEVIALKKAGSKAQGATLYVNLEPCSSYGRTPPCIYEIIKAGIKKVIIACCDLNPRHYSKGIKILRKNGIDVKVGVLAKEACELNKRFFKYIKEKRPWVTLKIAQSFDGWIATSKGESKWISEEKSRIHAHYNLRRIVDAVIVGVNTVLKDDPLLLARWGKRFFRKQPLRIILDSTLRIPIKAQLIKTVKYAPVLIATTKQANLDKIKLLQNRGVEILLCRSKNKRVDLKDFLAKLAQREIMHILVEGGGEVFYSFLKERLADELYIYLAPLILGKGKEVFATKRGWNLNSAPRLSNISVEKLNSDILVKADISY